MSSNNPHTDLSLLTGAFALLNLIVLPWFVFHHRTVSVQSWCCLGQRITNNAATLYIAQTQCSFCLSLSQSKIILSGMVSKQKRTVCFLILSIPLSRRESKLIFWSCAERPKALQFRTKVGEHQESGYVWVFSPHQPERCVRTTQIYVVWTPREQTVIKLWSASFCVKSEAEPTADFLRKPIVSQQHSTSESQQTH